MADLGFSRTEDIPEGMISCNETNTEATPPWEVSINHPNRLPGQDAKVEIAAGWMASFHEDWKRDVVYRQELKRKD